MWDPPAEGTGNEVCMIGQGVKSLCHVPLHASLQVLNLHCNEISRIENLEGLKHLKHLDLSSNHISEITGLEYLVNLRTLNLSSNMLKTIQGLEKLCSLVKLNVSYNNIANVSGFLALKGPEYKLNHVELQGNDLVSLDHVGRCLQSVVNLRKLRLTNGTEASNPCCHNPDYRGKMLSMLPQLQVLDNADRYGNTVEDQDALADIPGLEDFMDILASNDNSDSNMERLLTPKIDAVMQAYRQRAACNDITSSSDHDTANPTQSPKKTADKTSNIDTERGKLTTEHAARLAKLESQMINLLYSSQEQMSEGSATEESSRAPKSLKQHAKSLPSKRDIDDTEESDEDSSKNSQSQAQSRKQGPPSPSRQTSKKSQLSAKRGRDHNKLSVRGRSTSPSSRLGDRSSVKDDKKSQNRPARHATRDEQLRDDVQDTYVQIMRELEVERERRWKAEEAAKKLVEHIKHVQFRAAEEANVQDIAHQVTSRLKQAITNERENSLRLRTDNDQLKVQLKETTAKLQEAYKSEGDLREALRAAQDTAISSEKEQLKRQAHEGRKLQEAVLKSAAASREVEILQNNVKTLKGQIQQMHELLASREEQHRQDMKGRFTLGSPELQEYVMKEIQKSEISHAKNTEYLNQKIKEMTKDYENLEDEFRLALEIEADRFQKLQTAFESVSQEAASSKQALLSSQQKDEKSSAIVNELTSLVKEQKGRISELSKAKQEQHHENKERIQNLESHLEEARRRMVSFELMKQENVKLKSQVQAQISLMEGLRAEKKVWGEELAHQDSNLAQDRGRMEAKIEALNSELSTIKKQYERETDAVRIKAKVIDDQTETIRKLKDGLQERDVEVKKAREEALKIQKDLEERLSAELIANQEIQEKLDRARERKEQLKDELNDMEDKLEESKNAHSALNRKWKEKSSLIGQLEQQVLSMKSNWEAKERKLTDERDKAVNAASLAVEKLKAMDDAFRKQLDNKEDSHQRELEALEYEKQEEIDAANKRVIEVEDEMRQLLRESDVNKRNMEERMRKLTQAFSDIQKDMF